ncbi:MAG: DUF1934 domain-containing protein [Butyrivibrio sp.]|nr:DUF1934 domain-containing protein [Butyrivibrio sp.]
MNKKVCIKISGLHSMEDTEADEAIEVINIGSYYRRGGKHYVRYEEPTENSSVVNVNLLKISDNEIELIAKGRTGTHMIFTMGKKNMTYYSTPFGGMNIGIDTYDVNVNEEEKLITVDIYYGMELNLDYVAECHVHMEIESLED